MRFIINGCVTDYSNPESIFVSNFETAEVKLSLHQVHLNQFDDPIKYKQISDENVIVGFQGHTYELAYQGEPIKIPCGKNLVLEFWLNRIAE